MIVSCTTTSGGRLRCTVGPFEAITPFLPYSFDAAYLDLAPTPHTCDLLWRLHRALATAVLWMPCATAPLLQHLGYHKLPGHLLWARAPELVVAPGCKTFDWIQVLRDNLVRTVLVSDTAGLINTMVQHNFYVTALTQHVSVPAESPA